MAELTSKATVHAVIDALTLALTHSLMALAAWVLVMRDDLDEDGAAHRPAPRWRRKRDGNGPGNGPGSGPLAD